MSVIKFPNGVKLDVCEMPELNTATICVNLLGGIQGEPPLYNGMCEMISRLLLCGTLQHSSPADINQYAKLNGFNLSITADIEFLMIKVVCLKTKVKEAIDFVADIMFHSSFSDEYINIVKTQMKAEAQINKMNLSQYLDQLTNQSMFARTGLTNSRCGSPKSIERITRRKLLEQYSRFISPKNISIAVCGAVDSAEITDCIGTYFYTTLNINAFRQIKFVAPVNNKDGFVNIKNRKLNQSRINIAFPSFSYTSKERYMLDILVKLIETKIKASLINENYFKSITVENIVYANNGKLVFTILVDKDYAEIFIERILFAIANLKQGNITNTEFNAEKQAFITNFVLTYESEEKMAELSAKELSIKKKSFDLQEIFDLLVSINKNESLEALQQVLDFKKINIAYLGEPVTLEFLGKFLIEH